MHIAILSRSDGWHVQDLIRAAGDGGHTAEAVDFRSLASDDNMLHGCGGAVVRTMPSGSLEQVVFRMDLLQAATIPILNPPRAVETCVDKYLTNLRLAQHGIATPRTIVCQTVDVAMAAFTTLGRDVVIKPLFGSEGRGMVRVMDPEIAWRTFHAIEQARGILYIQEYVKHVGWDVRAFVIRGTVIGAMKRSSSCDWRTNVSQGGTAARHDIAPEVAELAVRASAATGAVVAGVDILPATDGRWLVLEVNAVPGWRSLAAVCEIDVASRIIHQLQAMA